MDHLPWLNFIANIILTIAFTMFVLFVFGRSNSRIYDLPWYKTIAVKIGLCLCTMGAMLNALTMSNPPISEIILNTGLAVMFTRAAWFHYRTFVIPYRNKSEAVSVAKKTRRKPRKRTLAMK